MTLREAAEVVAAYAPTEGLQWQSVGMVAVPVRDLVALRKVLEEPRVRVYDAGPYWGNRGGSEEVYD